MFFVHLRPVVNGDWPALETVAKTIVKEKQVFQRCVVKKEDLLKMFEVSGNDTFASLVLSLYPADSTTTSSFT